MTMTKTSIQAAVLAACAFMAAMANAEIPAAGLKIGVMTDMSGQFAAFSGPGSVAAAEIAVEEFGGKINGKPISVLSFDHQNKPDVAALGTRQWFDEGVNMAVDYPVSPAALAAQEVAREKKRIIIFSSAGTPALSRKACSPYGFQWTMDTYSLANGLAAPLAKQGVESFYFVSADYAGGKAIEDEFRRALDRQKLKALDGVKFPLNSPDMSAYVMSAQASAAKGIVIAGAGGDLTNILKTARSFGLTDGGKTIVAPSAFLTDVKGLGLEVTQGLMFVDPFYWDRDESSRRFAQKFYAKRKAMPTAPQSGVYSAVLHYLKSVQAANSVDADLVAAKMRETLVNDDMVKNGRIRPDGRLAHDMSLVRVKKPSQSKGEWDLLEIIANIPAEQTVPPLSESECPLVKK